MSKGKGDAKKKKGSPDEEDESTQNIMKFYRKKLEQNGQQVYKRFREIVDLALEEQENVKEFHAFDILKPLGCQCIFEGLIELQYKHLKEVKLYKAGIGDEGVKYIAQFMERSNSIEILVLPQNDITEIGCEYLGNALSPAFNPQLTKLKLDFNEIGAEGLKRLSFGLSRNQNLERLSLNYCNINSSGAKYLQEILGYVDSKLWSLKLKGNLLRNDGVYQLFRALQTNQALNKLVLTNNQFGESDEIPVIDKICEILTINTTCYYYDFTQNAIYDDAAKKLLEAVKLYKTVWRMELPDIMAKELKDEFKKVFKKRKKPKKKKKKKGGKKKKKK